ncbi:PEP-CTERM sorting domain-containing protein [uncultured Rhodoblastus sp.]|uniref:PEP-CTERM sorting domain-containing protein n=1 Tax=uncultured Rhodoblastus sp. TaxID=543037 RepID=UPI0025DFB12C|nr:PEP-CTERM sorting domain-containing protein [uncultured Rhodoblastus sp.]
MSITLRIIYVIGVLFVNNDANALDAPNIVWPDISNDTATIHNSIMSIQTSSRVAGAVDSLIFNDQQFVNSEDHGREIQVAAAFGNKNRQFFNPTEAGSAENGLGPRSTSYLMSLKLNAKNSITTETQMAYWLNPLDSKSESLSQDIVSTTITIGVNAMKNVINYQTIYFVPTPRILGGVEAPTGYMPPEFSTFWIYDPNQDKLKNVTGNLPYQTNPIILSTSDSKFAMGIYAPPQPYFYGYSATHFTSASMASPTVKWNAFFIENTVPTGELRFDVYLVVGSLKTVEGTLSVLDNPNFTLAPVASGVPEPSTWAMMPLGFVGLVLVAYRRTRHKETSALEFDCCGKSAIQFPDPSFDWIDLIRFAPELGRRLRLEESC